MSAAITPPPDAELDALLNRLQKLGRDMDRHAHPDWDEHEDVFSAVNAIAALRAKLAMAFEERDVCKRIAVEHIEAELEQASETNALIAAAYEAAATNAKMYLESGFINCPRCAEEVPTKDTDAEYALRDALAAPQSEVSQ